MEMEGTSKYATDWQCNEEKTEFFSRGKSMPPFACFATDDRFRVEFPFPLLLPTSPFRRKHHKNIWTDSQRIGGKGERRRRQLAGILRSGTDERRQRHKFGQTVIRGGGGRGGDSLRVPPQPDEESVFTTPRFPIDRRRREKVTNRGESDQ